jgi:anti-anti-sigma regulatory factor
MEEFKMLKLSLRKLQEDQLLVSAQGAIRLKNMSQFRNAIEIVIGRYGELLLDIGHVTEMDPAAAEMLVLARTTARVSGTTIKLVGLSKRISLLLFVKLVTTYGPPQAVPRFALDDQ